MIEGREVLFGLHAVSFLCLSDLGELPKFVLSSAMRSFEHSPERKTSSLNYVQLLIKKPSHKYKYKKTSHPERGLFVAMQTSHSTKRNKLCLLFPASRHYRYCTKANPSPTTNNTGRMDPKVSSIMKPRLNYLTELK